MYYLEQQRQKEDFEDSSSMKSECKRRKRKYSYQCREISSYKVFLQFVAYVIDPLTGEKVCDATGILSKECYQQWLSSRRTYPKKPEEAFRRALTAHCRGVDGRRPFTPDVEESLLSELRKKKQWKCFEGSKACGSIGVQGFPSLGYHEKKGGSSSCSSADIDTDTGAPHFSTTKNVSSVYIKEENYYNSESNLDNFAQDLELYEPYGAQNPEYIDLILPVSSKKIKQEPSPRRNSALLAEFCVNHMAAYDIPKGFVF